jgi:hypothetical protein
MKTPQRTVAAFALLLSAGCASSQVKPPYTAFESIPVPKGLEYRPDDSTIIETPEVKAGQVIYRGRLEPESLALGLRSNLEAAGWRMVGSTTTSRYGTTQVYEKGGTSLHVRIWEGGPFSWYTYVELVAVEMSPGRPGSSQAPVSRAAPAPTAAPMPSVSGVPVVPAPVITR